MKEEILKDNYKNYRGVVETGGIIHPSVLEDFITYGCIRADIELSKSAVMELLKRTEDIPLKISEDNLSKKGDLPKEYYLSKKEIVKYIMEFFKNFFGKDLDLLVRKESLLGHVKDKENKKTIRGVSKKHLGKVRLKYNLKAKVGNGGAVASKKSSEKTGYVVKEIRIDGKPSFLTIPILAHEYAHVLAFRSQKSIENYTNIETIPILIEHLVLDDAKQNGKYDKRISSLMERAAKYHHIDRYNRAVNNIKKTVEFLDNRKKNIEKKLKETIHYSRTIEKAKEMKNIMESYKRGEDIYGRDDYVDTLLENNGTYKENINPSPDISNDNQNVDKTDVAGVFVHGMGALYAYGLFDKYNSMDQNGKIAFKKFLCNCLNGNKTVEQMIEKYGIVIDEELVSKYTNQMIRYSDELLDRDTSR